MRKSNEWKRLTAALTRRTVYLVGSLAQSAEPLTLNQWVTGSNPVRPTNQISVLRRGFLCLFPHCAVLSALLQKIRIFRLMFRKVIWRKLRCCTAVYTARGCALAQRRRMSRSFAQESFRSRCGNKCAADIKISARRRPRVRRWHRRAPAAASACRPPAVRYSALPPENARRTAMATRAFAGRAGFVQRRMKTRR